MSELNEAQIKSLVESTAKTVAKETVHETLLQLGADVDHPLDMQDDFRTLREWRRSMESVRTKAVTVTVGVLVAGLLAAFWMGFKSYLGK